MIGNITFLAATLSVLLCPQAAPDGVVRGCTPWAVSTRYPDHDTCYTVVKRRYGDAQWQRDIKDFLSEYPGWSVKIDCYPILEFTIPEETEQ